MTTPSLLNIAQRLTDMAQIMPDAVAVAQGDGKKRDANGRRIYRQMTFRELDQDSNMIARGLREMGVKNGTRIALMVKQSIEFISLVFGLYKSGATLILIDPGMGAKQMLQCLSDADPEGFVAIPMVHAVRVLMRRRFPNAKLNVTVGRRWFWGGPTLDQFRARGHQGKEMAPTAPDDMAAIIFTSGSTGPAKGVRYSHRNFDTQVQEIRDMYQVQQGEVDVPGFPLFGLFNAAMGVTSIIPDMDPTRPADVNPELYIEAINDHQASQSFASPALWNKVSLYCEKNNIHLNTLRRIVTAGAPVPYYVLDRMRRHIHPEGQLHTPYGATESLPVASISAAEVLDDTCHKTKEGAGVCVGKHYPLIEWKVIRTTDGPITMMQQAEELPPCEIGELTVTGPVVTTEYVTRTEANALAKIVDEDGRIWHRMGDVGYLDEQDRFWFCGRKAHRVRTGQGTMYTIPCEAIFNQHEAVFRSALVGVGEPGRQRPVLIVEAMPDYIPTNDEEKEILFSELRELGQSYPLTEPIDTFLLHPSLPVDVRHNAKIFREVLTEWAAGQLK